jgi:3-oxoadipate enol-lactonase
MAQIQRNPPDLFLSFNCVSTQTIVFIHGFPLTHVMWKNQLSFFEGKISTLAYDIKGFGASHLSADSSALLDIDELAEDFLDLLDFLKLSKVIACGLSMGGYILQNAYKKSPGHFEKLILAHTRAAADTEEEKKKRYETIERIKTDGKEKFIESFFQSKLFSPYTRDRSPETLEYYKKLALSNEQDTLIKMLSSLAKRPDTTEVLTSISIPVLFIAGTNDVFTPPEHIRSISCLAPHGRFKSIQNASHFSPIEQPDEFNRIVYEFILDS